MIAQRIAKPAIVRQMRSGDQNRRGGVGSYAKTCFCPSMTQILPHSTGPLRPIPAFPSGRDSTFPRSDAMKSSDFDDLAVWLALSLAMCDAEVRRSANTGFRLLFSDRGVQPGAPSAANEQAVAKLAQALAIRLR